MPRILSPEEYAERYEGFRVDAAPRGPLAAGLSSGVDQLQSIGYGILGAGLDAAGLDRAAQWTQDRRRLNDAEGYYAGRPDLDQIENLNAGNAMDMAVYQLAKQGPTIGALAAANLIPGVGQAASRLGLASLGARVPTALGGGGLRAGADLAARQAAAKAGQEFGSSVVLGGALGAGTLYNQSVDAGDPSPFSALAAAPVYGALEAAVPSALRGALRAPANLPGGLARRMATAGALGAAGEAGTELAQNEMEMAFGPALTPEEAYSQRLNAAAMGALVGGPLGSLAGIRRPRLNVPETVDQGQFDLTQRRAPQYNLTTQMDPLQGRIDRALGLQRTTPSNYEKQFLEAYNAPSGFRVVDPATGLERELTAGEYQQMQLGELLPPGEVQTPLLRYNPSTYRVFSDGSVALSEQDEFNQRYAPQPVPAAQEFNLVTQMDPLQQRIDQNLGIGQVGAPKGYPTQFNTAFNEPTNLVGNDAATGRERPLTLGELYQLQTGGTVNKTPGASGADQDIETAAQAMGLKLTDSKGKPLTKRAQLFTKAVELAQVGAIDEGMLKATAEVLGKSRYGEVEQVLNQADKDFRAKRDAANVSQQSAPAGQPAASGAGRSAAPVGGVGNTGSVPNVEVGSGGNAGNTQPAGGQAAPVADTGVQRSAPVESRQSLENTSILAGANPATPSAGAVATTAPDPFQVSDQVVAEDGYVDDEDAWNDFRPDNGPEFSRLAPGLQQAWGEARKRGLMSFEAATQIAEENAAEDGANNDSITETIRQIFGDRDAQVITDAFVNKLPAKEIGEKHKLSRGRVAQLVGEGKVGQEHRAKKIKEAQKKFGWTDEYVNSLMGDLGGTQTVADPEGESRTDARIEDDNGDNLDTKTSFAEAGMSTISSEGGSTGYTDNVSDNTIKKLPPRDQAMAYAQRAVEHRTKADELFQRIRDARDSGADSIVENQGKKPLDEAIAEVRELRRKYRAEMAAAQAALQKIKGLTSAQLAKETSKAETEKQFAAEDAEERLQTAREQYDSIGGSFGAPEWEELSNKQREQIADLANRDKLDLAAINRIVGDQKFGKDGQVTDSYTADELIAELKKFLRVDSLGRRIYVVDKPQDLPASMAAEIAVALKETDAFGWTKSGKAVLIASRVSKGQGRAKFMHEVGGHLGAEGLLPSKLLSSLVGQLETWRDANDGSLESKLAKKAWGRVTAANTPTKDQQSELLAYFIEESMLAGIDPIASTKDSGPLYQWFRTLWAAFKVAVRKLGFKPEAMTAQDVVNLAYGAARLEVSGTWHGTAAQFRKFNHKFIGKGEGAQVFGWGTYVAQRFGVAMGYWKDDTRRKSTKAGGGFGNGQPFSAMDFSMRTFLSKNGLIDSPRSDAKIADDWKQKLEVAEKAAKGVLDEAAKAEAKLARITAEFDAVSKRLVDEVGTLTPAEKDALYKRRRDLSTERVQTTLAKPLSVTVERAEKDLNLVAEIRRKGGLKEIKAGSPDGMLMRIDTALTPEDTINYDEPLSKQNERVKEIMQGILEPINDEIVERENADWDELTGEDLFGKSNRSLGLISRLISDDVLGDWYADPATAKAVEQGDLHKAASLYLLSKGIRGIEFYDGDSRAVGKLSAKGRERALQELQDAKDDFFMGSATQDDVDAAQAKFAEADADFRKMGKNFVVFDERDIFRAGGQVAAQKDQMKFGKNTPGTGEVFRQTLDAVPNQFRGPVKDVLTAVKDMSAKGLDYVIFTNDLIGRAVDAGIKSAKTFQDLLVARGTEVRKLEREVERIADMYALVPEKDRDGERSVNKFLFESTRQGKWGYPNGKAKVDPELAAWFNSLDGKTQDFVKAVFKHGDDVLAKKKATVLKYTETEYDARIAAETDLAKKSELETDKQNSLKRFQRLFALREGLPYAPIKRTGNWVVVAKSPEYLAAEKAKDQKRMAELEKDEDHYQVSFTNTKWEARRMTERLAADGRYDSSGEGVYLRERDKHQDYLFGGDGVMKSLSKLRTRLENSDDQASAKMLRMVSDLYLEALAENSARKSEMRRRGIAGDVDMVASFAQQGKADANFMASVMYGQRIQDALQAMTNEAHKARDEGRASEIRNELVQRYAQSLDRPETPWLNRLTRLSSIYYLATSPAYYMQNLTQPWMMSLPAMTGRHEWAKANRALFKAYGELKGVVSSGKLLKQNFDLSKVPGDVRDAIQELANRGKIDIGLDTEMGEFSAQGKGKASATINKIDKGLRLAVQKVETINRLSTAMAAYRLEMAKTGNAKKAIDYADRILTETHGDYTGMNAPRVFNTPVGKVALQFRKFQLIQLSYYAKLVNQFFTKPDERMAALKMLGYSLGHTALFAGVRGLPGFAAFAWVAGKLLGDDDEPYDLEERMRKAIGDTDLANLIMRGALTLAGLDISGKVGAGNMLSILPFSNADLTTQQGRSQAVGELILGASGGMVSRMADGLGLLFSGDMYRGLEMTLPKGLGDALKAMREGSEGMTRRNGDLMLSKEEISFVESLMTGLGFTPVQKSVAYEQQQRVKNMDQNFQDRTTKVKNDYAKAVREKDTEAMAEARQAWTKLQEARVRNGYTKQPMSNLLKAPQEQAKREKNTINGVPFNKQNAKFVASQI